MPTRYTQEDLRLAFTDVKRALKPHAHYELARTQGAYGDLLLRGPRVFFQQPVSSIRFRG